MMIFSHIIDKFQIRFKDRESAAGVLGESLKNSIKKEERKNTIVLGIPRGGVVTGSTIATKLSCGFGIIVPRKLRAPHNEELAIGAIMEDKTTYLNDTLVKELDISLKYIEKEKLHQLEEIRRRTQLYSGKACDWIQYDLKEKSVILADDGAATGATLIVATRYLKINKTPRKLIIALPISPKGTIDELRNEKIDQIEVITSPHNRKFVSVEQYYHDFHQFTDQEVVEIISRQY
jgi:predicted phosphoribosyltransferase